MPRVCCGQRTPNQYRRFAWELLTGLLPGFATSGMLKRQPSERLCLPRSRVVSNKIKEQIPFDKLQSFFEQHLA